MQSAHRHAALRRRMWRPLLAISGGLVVLAACSPSAKPALPPPPAPASTGSTNSVPATTAGAAAGVPTGGQDFYVSLGDSYASGYQASGKGRGGTTRNGFAYQVPALAQAKGYQLTLVNFGCSGATVTSLRDRVGCNELGPDGTPYIGESQLAAAIGFLHSHLGHVALITVSIGGNDVIPCAFSSDPTACVVAATTRIRSELPGVVKLLRDAAGPATAIVGTTYPDIALGVYIGADPTLKGLARQSILAFKLLLNPALAQAYDSVGATFVDVTAASGAYGPFEETTTLEPFGTIPVPVARVCELTFFCDFQDIHPKTPGYRLIADLVIGALPVRRG
ncbi:MAG: hypothetical protein NVSMB16_02020 [Acidimicrobiales bacterium]